MTYGEYREYIEKLRRAWTGKVVRFEGKKYKVVDVDYNGALLLDKPNPYNDTTAVFIEQLDH